MKFLKKNCVLLAAAMICSAAVPLIPVTVHAAQASETSASKQYRETVIPLPKAQFQGQESFSLCEQPDGVLELFTTKGNGKNGKSYRAQYYHFTSLDGGKTWRAQDDMKWVESVRGGVGQPIESIRMDAQGVYYTLVAQQAKDKFTLYKGSGGQMKPLASVEATESFRWYPSIVAVTPQGEIVLGGRDSTNYWEPDYAIRILNTDGSLKTEMPSSFIPTHYAADRLFGDDWAPHSDRCDLVVSGVGSLAEARRIPCDLALDKDPDAMRVAWTVTADGAIWYTNINGLYRCAPEATLFEKVLDGAACSLGQKNLYFAFAEPSLVAGDHVYGMLFNQENVDAGSGFSLVRYDMA